MKFEASVGIPNIVIVQPSSYGNDNSCLLDVLRELGPARSRGVVQFDTEATSMGTLCEWHELGVRGVRINLHSVDKTLTPAELEGVLRRHADVVRPLGWVIQVYVPLHTVETLERIVPTFGRSVLHRPHRAAPRSQRQQRTQASLWILTRFLALQP